MVRIDRGASARRVRLSIGPLEVGDVREEGCLDCVEINWLRVALLPLRILARAVKQLLRSNERLRVRKSREQGLLLALRATLPRLLEYLISHISDLLDSLLGLDLGPDASLGKAVDDLCGVSLVAAANLDSAFAVADTRDVVLLGIKPHDMLVLEDVSLKLSLVEVARERREL